MSKPIVAIVGRPNVGKSTLFNRIVGQRIAITANEAGTTRDRIFAPVEWEDREFVIVDTGGLESRPEDNLGEEVRRQVGEAIADADAIIFLTDVSAGITLADSEVADALRRSQKPVILAANKVDNPTRELAMAEFYQFGIGDPLPVSAHHNQGIGVLLDEVVALLPYADDKGEQGGMRLAIVGRPNTGKSSLFNALVGEERVVVSEIPGTTRDSIDTRLEREGEGIVLVDTAGLRRRGKIQVGVEHFSALRAIRAIERANIALLLLDPGELGAAQDTHIAGYVLDAHKGLVLVVNKWDLGPDLDWSRVEVEEFLRARFKFAPYAPIVFTSAMKNTGLPNLLHVASKVHASRQQRVGTGELNRIVERAVAENLPRQVGRRRLHILYVTQSDIDPPTFVFFVNDPKLLHFSYRRYLENKIREIFDFEGTPLNFVFRRRGEG